MESRHLRNASVTGVRSAAVRRSARQCPHGHTTNWSPGPPANRLPPVTEALRAFCARSRGLDRVQVAVAILCLTWGRVYVRILLAWSRQPSARVRRTVGIRACGGTGAMRCGPCAPQAIGFVSQRRQTGLRHRRDGGRRPNGFVSQRGVAGACRIGGALASFRTGGTPVQCPVSGPAAPRTTSEG